VDSRSLSVVIYATGVATRTVNGDGCHKV